MIEKKFKREKGFSNPFNIISDGIIRESRSLTRNKTNICEKHWMIYESETIS